MPPRPDRPAPDVRRRRGPALWLVVAVAVGAALALVVGVLVAQDRAGTTAAGSASPTATADPSPPRSDGPFDDPALDLIETRLFGPGDADWSRFVADDGTFQLKAPGPAVRDDIEDGGSSYTFGPHIVSPVLYLWPIDDPIPQPSGFARWTIRRWIVGATVVDAPHPVEGTGRKVWEAAVERDGSTEVFRVTYGHDRLYVLAVSHWTRDDDAGELARRLLATFTLDPQPIVG